MKNSKLLILAACAAVLLIGVTGCKKTPKNVTLIPGAKTGAPKADDSAGLKMKADGNDVGVGKAAVLPVTPAPTPEKINTDGTIPLAGDGDADFPGYTKDAAMFKGNTVYFDFDKSTVKKSEHTKIDEVAIYLKSSASTGNKLLLEGHCDERGTEEYNRALGERRALAIREYLVRAGVASDRVFTRSYGEDKPAVPGHSEAAWSKNRRGEFVVLKPKP